jgi:hypothetical protein
MQPCFIISSVLHVFSVVSIHAVRLCLWTTTTNGPNIYQPDDVYDIWVWRDTVEWYWEGMTEQHGKNLSQCYFHQPQVLHGREQGHLGERPATNRLSHGTAYVFSYTLKLGSNAIVLSCLLMFCPRKQAGNNITSLTAVFISTLKENLQSASSFTFQHLYNGFSVWLKAELTTCYTMSRWVRLCDAGFFNSWWQFSR